MSRPFIPPAIAALRPIIVVDSEDGLALARDAGYAAGHARGLADGRLAGQLEGETRARDEARAELDAMRETLASIQARNTLAEALDGLLSSREETDRALECASRTVLVSALRTLFPVLLAEAAGTELASIVSEALTVRAPEPLTLRAHPDTLASLAGEAGDRLALVSDPALPAGAAELTWTGGGLVFDPAALLERVVSVLTPTPPSADTKDSLP